MSEKPEALKLADELKNGWAGKMDAVAELRNLHAENERLREALESIAANACCDRCQEAALVAKAALRREDV